MATKIKDPAMHPYFIGKDTYCYTVYEKVTPQERYLEKGSKGKDYEKPLGHYGNLANALKKIAKAKLDTKPEYNSILEYIKTWESEKLAMEELLNKIGI